MARVKAAMIARARAKEAVTIARARARATVIARARVVVMMAKARARAAILPRARAKGTVTIARARVRAREVIARVKPSNQRKQVPQLLWSCQNQNPSEPNHSRSFYQKVFQMESDQWAESAASGMMLRCSN